MYKFEQCSILGHGWDPVDHQVYLDEVHAVTHVVEITDETMLQNLLSKLRFHLKYPHEGRLLQEDIVYLGLKKFDRLIPGADLVDIHAIDKLDIYPSRVVFFFSICQAQQIVIAECLDTSTNVDARFDRIFIEPGCI